MALLDLQGMTPDTPARDAGHGREEAASITSIVLCGPYPSVLSLTICR
jgi:hypothetical protein